ncbi:MAG: c-type cytochrome [Pirellulales bacterium]|nr:c-type cytochrome [Pirellulales bacterium]
MAVISGFAVGLLQAIGSGACADDFPQPYNSEKATTAPMPPEEVVRTAKLPPGFKLSVFAAEPDVQNPIAITTDERGRLWVAENYTWSGASFGNYDTSLKDRIVILADRDGDGRHDQRTVFWDQGHKVTSVEVGYGGVWVLALPNLLFIPDANRDDVPDGPPRIVLEGLDEQAVGHTPANGLKWGPDGWLYARHGIQATSRIGAPGTSDSQRVAINTGVWRYHPTRRTVETVLHGMTNSWGFDYDAQGEMYVINTVIGHLWHLVPGSHVERMYGIDLNPHVYSLMAQAADHVHWDTGEKWNDIRHGITDKTNAAGGGHAHIGLMIYQGDNWPAEYRGRVYTLNLHGQRINSDILEPAGAGFTAKHGPDLCFIADPWYRGMDLITGADGGVFIADWSDTGECHDHDGVHRTSGRIYKLTYETPPALAAFDLAQRTNLELCEQFTAANAWWPRQVLQQWRARAASGQKMSDVAAWLNALPAQEGDTAQRRLQRLWGLAAIDQLDEPQLLAALDDPAPEVRAWGVRLLVDSSTPESPGLSPAAQQALVRHARHDPAGIVSLYLASALQRLPVVDRWPLAEALARRGDWAQDRLLPHLLWYGIEPAVPRDPSRAIALVASSPVGLLRRHVARRLTVEIESQPQAVADLLALAQQDPASARSGDIVAGMAEALRGWRQAPAPADWPTITDRLAQGAPPEAIRALQELNVVFGAGRALDDLRTTILDAAAEPAARQQALRALLAGRPSDAVPMLHDLLGDRAVLTEALRGLALYDHPDTPAQIVGHINYYTPEARREMVNTLASRPAYARALLDAAASGQIATDEISAFHARQMRAFEDEELTGRLTEVWGEVRTSAAEKRTMIEEWRSRLSSDFLASANPQAGRAHFNKLCANCHVLFGVGRKLGPDLTGSNRKNLDYLLENVLDPSASVGTDFRAVNIALADGRLISGVLSQQTERTLTLQTAQEAVTIDRTEIDELATSDNSMMPDGLLQNLSAEEVRDLFAYLMSLEQVSLAD